MHQQCLHEVKENFSDITGLFPSLCIHFYFALIDFWFYSQWKLTPLTISRWPQTRVLKCLVFCGHGAFHRVEKSDSQCMFGVNEWLESSLFFIPALTGSTVLSPWHAVPSASPAVLQSGRISFSPSLSTGLFISPFCEGTAWRPLQVGDITLATQVYFPLESIIYWVQICDEGN